MSDPFAHPAGRCGECGGTDGGHFITCSELESEDDRRLREQVARNGVCRKCNFVRPCGCD